MPSQSKMIPNYMLPVKDWRVISRVWDQAAGQGDGSLSVDQVAALLFKQIRPRTAEQQTMDTFISRMHKNDAGRVELDQYISVVRH